jgi:catechol 2,3-dioxygenase-like lactoylglutathione lyase family enzyme
MANLNSSVIKTFIGSRNFNESRDFYVALGWRLIFDAGDLAELELSGYRFYLQNYYQRQWCENSMLHITVEDAAAWYGHVKAVLETQSYGAARVKAPEEQDYGALVTHVWDPVGVLLHFAQPLGGIQRIN